MMEGDELLQDGEKAFFQKFAAVFDSPEWEALTNEWRNDLAEIPVRAFYDARSWDEILAARALVTKLREYISYPAQIDMRKQAIIVERMRLDADNRESSRPDV